MVLDKVTTVMMFANFSVFIFHINVVESQIFQK